MSRNLLIVLGITLILPIVATIAIVSTAGVSSELLTTFLVGGVVMTFIVGAIFEIKRIAEQDGLENSTRSKPIVDASLASAKVYAAAPLSASDMRETPGMDHAVARESHLASLAAPESTAPEPISIELAGKNTNEKGTKKRTARRKAASALPTVPTLEVPAGVATRKPKTRQRKRPEVV